MIMIQIQGDFPLFTSKDMTTYPSNMQLRTAEGSQYMEILNETEVAQRLSSDKSKKIINKGHLEGCYSTDISNMIHLCIRRRDCC